MTEAEKKTLATSFIDSLRSLDSKKLKSITTEDVVWSLPGSSLVSGEARGVKGIMQRAQYLADYAVNLEILYVLIGYHDVALSLHNSGTHNGKVLDEHLTTVCHLEGDRIKRLDTLISSVPMVNEYFS